MNIGIDLGTTNSALAYVEAVEGELPDYPEIRVLQIPQYVAPGQVDLGTTNEPFADPAPELPLFKLTCDPKFAPHPFLGRVVYTHDPGFALTTGKCADIGKITMQSMRGLAARPPYFSNCSARTLREVIDFYDRRYNIGFSEKDKQDLTNLMSVL